MSRLSTIVFMLRQSPDWGALAEDYTRGLSIAPERYVPARPIPSFPGNIVECVQRWNETYRVDFFTCRAELRRIARQTLDAVERSVVLTPSEFLERRPAGDHRVFFVDDDDWFAPDTIERISVIGDEDVSVFPLLRLDVPVFTFVRPGTSSACAIGFPNRFSNRFQTNNYALHPRLCSRERLDALADHLEASEEADRLQLGDVYYDVMVSVTNKSPASASVVPRILEDTKMFGRLIEGFVGALRNLVLPAHAAWMERPIAETADLFSRAIGLDR